MTIGRSVQGKTVNLGQLEQEVIAAGVTPAKGMGMSDDLVYTFDTDGYPADFPTSDTAAVDQAITDHVAMRDKTDAEYAEEFQNPATTPERKQELRDISAGLLPPEQVPM